MSAPLETRRLLLRPLRIEDAEQVQRVFPHWEIVRYLNAAVPWPYPPDGAFIFFRDVALPAIARGEQWFWTLRRKTHPDEIIGAISLMTTENNNRGFWLGLPWQRQGYMSEAVETTSEFWFSTLGFPVLRAPKAAANVGSRRISEKSGMRVVGRDVRDYVSGRFPTEIWEITADEWRARPRV